MQTVCRFAGKLYNALTDAIWPRCCPACGKTLTDKETCLCLGCLAGLPRTFLHRDSFNELHHQLGTHVPLDKAMAWFWYYRGNDETAVIIDAKYHDRPRLISEAAALYTAELSADNCHPATFADIIIPAPMHWTKRMVRGYNQTEWLARGISRECGLPVANLLKATRKHRTQTRLSASERADNLKDSMLLTDAGAINGRRVLIVDDIITTGATMRTAVEAVAAGKPASVSVLALGAAKKT